jgi:plastocyanin
MRIIAVIALSLAVLVGVSCSSDEHGHGHGDEPAGPVAANARRIAVVADQLRFAPASISATAGEEVAVGLTSVDVLHDFVIDDLDVHVSADAGASQEAALDTSRPGTYTYYCSVEGHRAAGMEGTLVVE